MDNLRVEFFPEEKKVKVYVNATLVQTIDVDKAFVIEAEIDWKSVRTMNFVGSRTEDQQS